MRLLVSSLEEARVHKAFFLLALVCVTAFAGDENPCFDLVREWPAAKGRLTDSVKDREEAERLYCYWKLNLPHTFLNAYVAALSRKHGPKATLWTALENEVGPSLEGFLEKNGVIFTPEQERIIRSLPVSPAYNRLKAWTSFRKGIPAKEAMELLPKGHPWKAALSKTVTLALARKGKNREAIALIKAEMDAAAAVPFRKEVASVYALELARFLYQTGDIDEAEKWYDLVPIGTDEYVPARQELAWIWLRKGDAERLRGTIESLSTPVFDNKMDPELYAVRAVSNLKLCHYEKAQKDFEAFMTANRRWVRAMESAPEAAEPVRPPDVDWYVRLVDRAVASAEVEAEKLSDWKGGPWKKAAAGLSSEQRRLARVRASEYRRQWKNASASLREAIIKMRFVKVELMRQLDEVKMPSVETAVARENQERAVARLDEHVKDSDLVFPYDGVVWPDELFRLRSDASNRCL